MKIAIHFYGHLRTYKKTYEYFVKNILHPNYTFASNIDIFFHTWDELNTTDGMGPSRRLFNAKLNHVSVTKEDIKELLSLYKPKRYIIEKKDVFYGRDASIKRVYKLRKEYEKEKCFTYDYYIFLRFDLLFATPFLLEEFISVYSGGEMLKMTSGLPENFVFIGSNIFRRCKVADFRFFQETDLFWISNYGDDWDIWVDNNFNFDVRFPVVPIAIDYKLNTDFYIWRDIYDLKKDIDPLIEVRKSILKHNEIEKNNLLQENQKLNQEKNNLKIILNSYDIQEKKLRILNLEQDIVYKKLKIKLKEQKINKPKPIIKRMQIIYSQSAIFRIQNQLSYKLGQAMIVNSKSILGYIRMLFVLSYIKDKHKQEQKIYQEKIKKDPSLKLPPLEDYLDYQEALKEKECFTYKLGQALIQANKTWYKGGYIRLLLEIRKLKREFLYKQGIK